MSNYGTQTEIDMADRIAELEQLASQRGKHLNETRAQLQALREAARRVTGGVSHRDMHVLGPSSRLVEAIDTLRAALKQGEE